MSPCRSIDCALRSDARAGAAVRTIYEGFRLVSLRRGRGSETASLEQVDWRLFFPERIWQAGEAINGERLRYEQKHRGFDD